MGFGLILKASVGSAGISLIQVMFLLAVEAQYFW